jgi:starch synthase
LKKTAKKSAKESPKGKPLKILVAAAEAAPIAKVGGLADIAYELPKTLNALGHDARIIMPRHGIIEAKYGGEIKEIMKIEISFFGTPAEVTLSMLETAGVKYYLVGNENAFGNEVYKKDYEEQVTQYLFFQLSVAAIIRHIKDFTPDILHINDWHTGLLSVLLSGTGEEIKTVFTIHNLKYQGKIPGNDLNQMRVGILNADFLKYQDKIPGNDLNQMRIGILNADFITTVSPSYAKEILTEAGGMGLDEELRLREKEGRFLGIVNGI